MAGSIVDPETSIPDSLTVHSSLVRFLGDEEVEAEQAGVVKPGLGTRESGVSRKSGQLIQVEFIRVLGMYRLALIEMYFQIEGPDVDDLLLKAFQANFYSARFFVVSSAVTEAPYVKIAAKLTVDSRQQVEIERRSHAQRIVVSGQENLG